MGIRALWKRAWGIAKDRGFGLKMIFRFGGKKDNRKREKKMKSRFGIGFFAVAIAAASQAQAAGFGRLGMEKLREWKAADYEIAIPAELVSEVRGQYDVTNGDWLAGYGVDVLWFKRKKEDRPIAYLAANHLFNASERGKGSIGGTLGISTGKLGTVADKVFQILIPSQRDRFVWFGRLGNFVSLEVGGGYRAFGAADGVSRLHWGVGGKVKVPVNRFLDLFRGKS